MNLLQIARYESILSRKRQNLRRSSLQLWKKHIIFIYILHTPTINYYLQDMHKIVDLNQCSESFCEIGPFIGKVYDEFYIPVLC